MNTYPVRSIARLTISFADDAGAYADPTVVTLTIVTPDGKSTIHYNVTRDSAGHYHYDHTVVSVGIHRYKWQADGTLVVATEYQLFRGIA